MVSLSFFRNLYTHQIEYHGRFFLHYGQIKFQFQTAVSVETMRMAARPLTEDVVDNQSGFIVVAPPVFFARAIIGHKSRKW